MPVLDIRNRKNPAVSRTENLSSGEYNRKSKTPSDTMLQSNGQRYKCDWINGSITIHSDGNVSCGLDDPHGQRSFGNIGRQTIAEIFANPEYEKLQRRLWEGSRCADCGHFYETSAEDIPPYRKTGDLPKRMVVEATVKCNIRCPNPPCLANNDAQEVTRDSDFLKMEALSPVVDELQDSLDAVYFYNYGETFLNKEADFMLAYMRNKIPNAAILTSTNGIPLSNLARAARVVEGSPTSITFTISGVNQEAYARYHVNGKLEQALGGLKNVCSEKVAQNRDHPKVIWRYLVFNWNDSDAEIDAAIQMAADFGVDELSLYLTNTPENSRSLRFSPGNFSYYKYKKYIHFDHLGRLDHVYNCELPDENGLWRSDEMEGFGKFLRMGSQALLSYDSAPNVIHFELSTDDLEAIGGDRRCLITTPWLEFEIRIIYNKWQAVDLEVPDDWRGKGSFQIKLTASHVWFPAQRGLNGDPRCLGLLVRSDSLIEA